MERVTLYRDIIVCDGDILNIVRRVQTCQQREYFTKYYFEFEDTFVPNFIAKYFAEFMFQCLIKKIETEKMNDKDGHQVK